MFAATTISADYISMNMLCPLSAADKIAPSYFVKCFKMMSNYCCSSFIYAACYSLQLCPAKCSASVRLAFVVLSSAVDYYYFH